MQPLDRNTQLLQPLYELAHCFARVPQAVIAQRRVGRRRAQVKVQLSQPLLLLPDAAHLFHGGAAAERAQLARMEVGQQTQQCLLHVAHVWHFGKKTVMSCARTTRVYGTTTMQSQT